MSWEAVSTELRPGQDTVSADRDRPVGLAAERSCCLRGGGRDEWASGSGHIDEIAR